MTEEHKQFFLDFLMVWNPLEYGFWAKIYKRKPVLRALNHVNDVIAEFGSLCYLKNILIIKSESASSS